LNGEQQQKEFWNKYTKWFWKRYGWHTDPKEICQNCGHAYSNHVKDFDGKLKMCVIVLYQSKSQCDCEEFKLKI